MGNKNRSKFYAPKGTKYGDIWNKQKGRCHYCGAKMVPLPKQRENRRPILLRHATIVHIEPLSKSGSKNLNQI